jgi:hypothetical protein
LLYFNKIELGFFYKYYFYSVMSTTNTNANVTRRIELLEKQVALLLQAQQHGVSLQNSLKNVATYVLPPKPKRPPTGYVLFCNAMRDDAKSKLASQGTPFTPQQVMTELAAMWKSLSHDELHVWNSNAKL